MYGWCKSSIGVPDAAYSEQLPKSLDYKYRNGQVKYFDGSYNPSQVSTFNTVKNYWYLTAYPIDPIVGYDTLSCLFSYCVGGASPPALMLCCAIPMYNPLHLCHLGNLQIHFQIKEISAMTVIIVRFWYSSKEVVTRRRESKCVSSRS
jgi:hypothetical protein